MVEFFIYGDEEINHLKRRDKKLGAAIDRIGIIKRETHPDIFASLIKSVINQQISNKAAATVWSRLLEKFNQQITPANIDEADLEYIRSAGMSIRKASYIKSIAQDVITNKLSIDALVDMSDEEVIKHLSGLRGIGVWTAEMIMIFSLKRPNVLSYGDLGIQRGMKRLYNKTEITRDFFEKCKKSYSPYCTVASLYLWAIAA